MVRMTVVLAAALITFAPAPAHAQFGKLKDKIKQRVDDKVDKKIDCTLDKYMDKKECKDAKAREGASAGAREGEKAGGRDGVKASGGSGGNVGEGAWANYDFVPGDKIIFAEDFTVDRVGNFPKRMELDEGTFEVVEWNGRRWLRAGSDGQFTITLPQTLPERWTMEFEMTIPWTGMLVGTDPDLFDKNALAQIIFITGTEVRIHGASKDNSAAKGGTSVDPRTLFPNLFETENSYLSKPMHVRIQADGSYMKVYLEEQRVGNLPNMGRWQGNKIRFYFRENNINGKLHSPLITNISINAGGKEMYEKLMANGRLAVQGIYFDVGSDRIRPESSGTLAEIGDMLKEHADLKLTVEGHTDNVGASDKNKALSQARATAVVKYLTEKGIDAGRLTPVGFGDSKPAAANDTPENRQKNRRVELVKI